MTDASMPAGGRTQITYLEDPAKVDAIEQLRAAASRLQGRHVQRAAVVRWLIAEGLSRVNSELDAEVHGAWLRKIG